MNTYDLKAMRIELINILTSNLNKNSKWYLEDKEHIIKNVNKMHLGEMAESLGRQKAILSVTQHEINKNCII